MLFRSGDRETFTDALARKTSDCTAPLPGEIVLQFSMIVIAVKLDSVLSGTGEDIDFWRRAQNAVTKIEVSVTVQNSARRVVLGARWR